MTLIDVSAPAQHPQDLGRAGVLVITVWISTEGAETLRLRVVSNADVIAGTEHRFNSTEPEEVLAYVKRWLDSVTRE